MTDLEMLVSNNVNLRPGEQYAIDTIQQQLLSAILGFGVATSASGLAPSVYCPVAAAATRTISSILAVFWDMGLHVCA
ncbi:hypothetical protein DPMN_003693 [Dreissena polymorpha]|uniref:Uncharacterized protein n=1 Tax=Dreissena polymorpha TaxID=45954 RepID=A0A9D4MLF9_DREPO|nr:hypothetical protein DPMN_003693 [Dreissena polymorpha]